MKKLLALLAFLSALFIPSFASAQVTTICDSQTVPAGQVIIKRYSTAACPGVNGTYQNATLDIRAPVSPMSMCSESPYPASYIIAAHLTTNDCWNLATMQHTRATWTMRTPVSPDSICTNSLMPAGYVIKQSLNSSVCFTPSGTTNYSSYDIKIPGTQENVCSFSPIPAGYTIIQLISIPNCVDSGGGPGGQGYVIKKN